MNDFKFGKPYNTLIPYESWGKHIETLIRLRQQRRRGQEELMKENVKLGMNISGNKKDKHILNMNKNKEINLHLLDFYE